MYLKKVIFVCLGNICRSPAAEGIFKFLVEKEGLTDQVFIDSAGMIDYHRGECSDSRMIKEAEKRGYKLDHLARMFVPKDLHDFDYIIAMDDEIFKKIKYLDKNNLFSEKIFKMAEFLTRYPDKIIPDPYYGSSMI